jgi:hypothetical protein
MCKYCTDPTKKVAAFVEKENDNHDQIYTCDNLECSLRMQVEDELANIQAIKDSVRLNNRNLGINMDGMKRLRIESCTLIYDICAIYNISTPQYSAYENHYQPIPKDLYDNILTFLNIAI